MGNPPIVSFALLASVHDHRWEMVLATAIGGLGLGLALSALSAVVVNAVPAGQIGAAAGMNANVRTIGGALGAALVSSILGSHLDPQPGAIGLPTETGYAIAFATLAAAGVLSLIACLLIRTPSPSATAVRRRKRRHRYGSRRAPRSAQPLLDPGARRHASAFSASRRAARNHHAR